MEISCNNLGYLGLIPKDIIQIILYNLDMNDIINILGNTFYISNRYLFKSLLQRDFGKDINLDLISEDKEIDLTAYESFLEFFRSYEMEKSLYDPLVLKVWTKLVDLENIGIYVEPQDKTLDYHVESVLLDIRNGSRLRRKIIHSYGITYSYIKVQMTRKNIFNLLFYYSDRSIFSLKDKL